jgi:hypothetical protein
LPYEKSSSFSITMQYSSTAPEQMSGVVVLEERPEQSRGKMSA